MGPRDYTLFDIISRIARLHAQRTAAGAIDRQTVKQQHGDG